MLIGLLLAAASPASPAPTVPPSLRPWTTARHAQPESLVHLIVHDPAGGRNLGFSVFDDPQPLGLRIVRSGSRPRVQVTLAQCPALRGNLEALARLPAPPLFLEGMSARPALAAPNRLIYRIEGHARFPDGQAGLLQFEERGSDGAPPGALALWSEALARDFERCVQDILSSEGAQP